MKEKTNTELKEEIADLKIRSLEVYEQNNILKHSPEVAKKMAIMEYDLKIAEKFSRSKAFPDAAPEQIYTLIKAGEEMNLSPIVSLNMLYVVNGHIGPYGDKMLGYILSKGYRVKYTEESDEGVTVEIYKIGESYIEKASIDDEVLKKSKAIKFAAKHKLRFHAIRMIASFHLPHLFMGCSDGFSEDYKEYERTTIQDKNGNIIKQVTDINISEILEAAKDIDELEDIKSKYKAEITKDIILLTAYGDIKKEMLKSEMI